MYRYVPDDKKLDASPFNTAVKLLKLFLLIYTHGAVLFKDPLRINWGKYY